MLIQNTNDGVVFLRKTIKDTKKVRKIIEEKSQSFSFFFSEALSCVEKKQLLKESGRIEKKYFFLLRKQFCFRYWFQVHSYCQKSMIAHLIVS
jgi:hypothetical protein